MKAIYVGSIKSLGVKSLEINGSNVSNIVYESTVVREDAQFYPNRFQRMISIDYDTFMPTKEEAEIYVNESIVVMPDGTSRSAHCVYCDDDYKYDRTVTNQEFKEMKTLAKYRKKK